MENKESIQLKVTRASLLDNSKPCEEAFERKFTEIDERFVDDPTKIPAYSGTSEWWTEHGSNHRIEKGHIKRDFEKMGWFVEIKDSNDILAFQKKYGSIIIQPAPENPAITEIIINDIGGTKE
jgi:hypothetical protein